MKNLRRFLVLVLIILTSGFLVPNSFAEEGDYVALGNTVQPSKGGSALDASCFFDNVAVGIRVAPKADNVPYLQHFELACLDSAMTNSPQSQIDYQTFVAQAPSNSKYLGAFCPSGYAMIGLAFATNAYISDVKPICAAEADSTLTWSPPKGMADGLTTTVNSQCPVVNNLQTYVIGVQGNGAAGVDSMQVKCGLPFFNPEEHKTKSVLLGTYYPQGVLVPSNSIKPIEVNSNVVLSPLTQSNNNPDSGLNIYPLRTTLDPNQNGDNHLTFSIKPKAGRTITLTKIIYSSASYSIGTSMSGSRVSSLAANRMTVSMPEEELDVMKWIPPSESKELYFFSRFELSDFSSFDAEREINIEFSGATGLNFNSLDGTTGALGLKIYGEIETQAMDHISPPENVVTKYSGGKLLLSMDLVDDLELYEGFEVYLVSPDLGITNAKKLVADIQNNVATFSIPLNAKFAGKTIPFQVWAVANNLVSEKLLKNITVPKTISPSPKATPTATKKPSTPTKKPTVQQIKCGKAGLSRTFTGKACPPGWVKK